MTVVDSTGDARVRRRWVVAATTAVVLYAIVSLVFVFRGRLNADEGWYLYAGKLVFRGKLPYRDFAFPQMPLSAYTYGVSQLFGTSLRVGRVMSLGFGVAAVVLCVRVAWREAGRAAGVAVAVLCLAFPTGIYNLTLTKTYAISAFLLAAVLFALTSPGRPARTWPLATAAAIALTATRTTGLSITVLVVLFCVVRAPDRATRHRVFGVSAVGGGILAAFLLADVSAAKYDLVTFHNLLWYGAPGRTRLDTIVRDRLPDWLENYAGYVALSVAAIAAVYLSKPLRAYLARQPGVAIVGLGIATALASQLVAGEWAPVEYASPVIPALITVTIVMLGVALRPAGGWGERRGIAVAAGVAVAALAISTIVHPGFTEYLTEPGDAGSITNTNELGDFLRAHTRDGDEILALWAQPAAYASGRDEVPGVTVGPFSYEDLTTKRARDLHYVNADLLRNMLRSRRPAAVVITGIDHTILGSTGTFSNVPADPQRVLSVLESGYHLAHRTTGYGIDGPIPFDVYLRNDRK